MRDGCAYADRPVLSGTSHRCADFLLPVLPDMQWWAAAPDHLLFREQRAGAGTHLRLRFTTTSGLCEAAATITTINITAIAIAAATIAITAATVSSTASGCACASVASSVCSSAVRSATSDSERGRGMLERLRGQRCMPGLLWLWRGLLSAGLWHGCSGVRVWSTWVRQRSLLRGCSRGVAVATTAACAAADASADASAACHASR